VEAVSLEIIIKKILQVVPPKLDRFVTRKRDSEKLLKK
jgi:hypothetical protein